MTLCILGGLSAGAVRAADAERLELLPYPQEIEVVAGKLPLGPAKCVVVGTPSDTARIAMQSLESYLPRKGNPMQTRLGSAEEGYQSEWLSPAQREFLADPNTSPEASVLIISADGITVVGKGKWGMLYGVQTVNQLAIQAARGAPRPEPSGRGVDAEPAVAMAIPPHGKPSGVLAKEGEIRTYLPCLTVRDWPDVKWRCLSPQLAWYAGWGTRCEGYDNGNWSLTEWKWMVDWSLLHKCNAWAMCMYGKWPFTLPGYEEETLDFDSFYYDMKTGQKTPFRYTHRNIKKEFLPELCRYANARGVKVDAYIGKNTFNGMYIKHHPGTDSGSFVKEAIPFVPGVHEYWDAFIKRILESGFNGFVFEDPETFFTPNQNADCYKTFWEPWAKEYGFKSVADTTPFKPPIGVHVEYYTWLFRQFDAMIQKHAKELGRPEPEIYLISHILINRIMKESKTPEEQVKWLALIDQKHGRKLPFVLFEDNENEYVKFLGKDRAATLGGRGGASSGAYRIAGINNDRGHGDHGMDLAEERDKQRRMVEAGGYGAMAYIFQWTHTEVFGYLGAQYLWRHTGVPGINNEDDFGILDYAYRIYYGDDVGALAAKSYGVNSCVREYMVFEDAPPVFYDGGPLHREYQLLVVMAEESDRLAQQAYKLFTGKEPDLYHPVYDQDAFQWNGYDAAADKLFKTERLRLLCVSARRAKELCTIAWSTRVAKQKIAQGASIGAVCSEFDTALEAARTSELLYFANYEDDYTEGVNSTHIRTKLEGERSKFLSDCGAKDGVKIAMKRPVPDAVQKAVQRRVIINWEKQTDLLPQKAEAGKPGVYLSTDLGLSSNIDYFCLSGIFTVQARGRDGAWHTIFRRALLKKDTGWQHWDIPLDNSVATSGKINLRLITDAGSRAIDRDWPTWKWCFWGQPQVVQVMADGRRQVLCDLIEHIDRSTAVVQLDKTGTQRAFDGKGEDSTGATFMSAGPADGVPVPVKPAIAAFAPHRSGNSGVTIAEYEIAK